MWVFVSLSPLLQHLGERAFSTCFQQLSQRQALLPAPRQDVLALLSHSFHSSLLRRGSLIHQISIFAHCFFPEKENACFLHYIEILT